MSPRQRASNFRARSIPLASSGLGLYINSCSYSLHTVLSSQLAHQKWEIPNRETEKRLKIMALMRKLVLAVMVAMVFSVAAVAAARPLAGEELALEATGSESFVSSLRQLYWQRLNGPGHSCSTWNPNGGCWYVGILLKQVLLEANAPAVYHW
jgi:hypothetical protein